MFLSELFVAKVNTIFTNLGKEALESTKNKKHTAGAFGA